MMASFLKNLYNNGQQTGGIVTEADALRLQQYWIGKEVLYGRTYNVFKNLSYIKNLFNLDWQTFFGLASNASALSSAGDIQNTLDRMQDRTDRVRYLTVNIPGLASRKFAQLTYGIAPTITSENEREQAFIDDLSRRSQLDSLLLSGAIYGSAQGDAVYRIRQTDAGEVFIERQNPIHWFPVIDNTNTSQILIHRLVSEFKHHDGQEEKTFTQVEHHMSGFFWVQIYEGTRLSLDMKKPLKETKMKAMGIDPSTQETGSEFPLVFLIRNRPAADEATGQSDYSEPVLSQMEEATKQLIQLAEVTRDHAHPKMAAPSRFFKDGNFRMSGSRAFPIDTNRGAPVSPEYLKRDFDTEGLIRGIELLTDAMLTEMEVSKALVIGSKSAAAESAEKARLDMVTTELRAREMTATHGPVIQDMILAASQFANFVNPSQPALSERPRIKWNIGIADSESERIERETKLVAAGLATPRGARSRIFGINVDEEETAALEAAQAATARPTFRRQQR